MKTRQMSRKNMVELIKKYPAPAALAGLGLLSLALRLWPVLAVRSSFEDAYFYIELARSLSLGRFELMGEFHAKYLPGFPAAILAMHTLLLGQVDWFRCAQLVSATASAAIPGLCWLVARRLSGDVRAAWAAGLIAAFNAQLVVFGGLPWSEAWSAFLFILALVLIPRVPLMAGVIAGLAAITRHEGWFLGLAFAAAMAGGMFERDGKKSSRLTSLAPLLAGAAIMVLIAAGWWLWSWHRSGHWLFETYTQEEAARRAVMTRAGAGFLLLSFPVAGHLATLLGLPGLAMAARRRAGWPMLAFLAAYLGIHAWWLFRVERYFVPMVPIVAVLAGCGAGWLADRLGPGRAARWLPVAAGAVAGLTHFFAFAPAMVHEESVKTVGYYQAIQYLRTRPGQFTVIAYDAFMVGYHSNRPVVPSATIPPENWVQYVPDLFVNQRARYILWSDIYPTDRDQGELASPEPFWIHGPAIIDGVSQPVTLEATAERVIPWSYQYPRSGWLRPWRSEVSVPSLAIVFRLEIAPPE
jgi:hypothetical protein